MADTFGDDEHEVHSSGAGASVCYPMQCSRLKKGGHVVIKDRPCKVVDMSTSKTGKHGHAKVHFVGIDIFTGKKLEDICPSTHTVQAPNVSRIEYNLTDIADDGFVTLMSDDGSMREDLKLPNSISVNEARSKHAEVCDGKELTATVVKALMVEEIIELKMRAQSN